FVGKEAAFEGKEGVQFPGGFTDGTSNTALAAEAGEPVPWTKPEDLPFDAKKPLPKLGGLLPNGFYLLTADGAVHFVKKKFNEDVMRLIITRNDGMPVEFDKLDKSDK